MAEDFDRRVIEQFPAEGGRVDGFNLPLLLLTVAGRRTGRPRTTPLAYREDGGRYLVFASNGGSPQHPWWYRNLLAAGGGTAEVPDGEGGTSVLSVRPVLLEGAERARQFAAQAADAPAFADYARRTDRTIPVVALHPLDLAADPRLAGAVLARLRLHHEDLRRQLADLRDRLEQAEGFSGSDLAARLRERCLSFCYGLDLHHRRAEGAFTAFEQRYPPLIPALARLRVEHRTVADALARFETRLADPATAADPAALRAELDRLTTGLETYFAHEEEQLTIPPAPHPER
ncbi:nitroreductase/quinone reductase family protein [Kitasatospora sp. NPDC088134]|uniref:nitroreductase/quinone reductase family protein n=1 Tax=Kitasatospora sp. NPDC088134 TaxID=3364071 RepID=UPI0037F9FD13